MKIKTALIFDNVSIDYMDEALRAFDFIRSCLTENHSLINKLLTTDSIDIINKSFDLIVLDYGGMADTYTGYGYDIIRCVCHYAEDHPSTLILLWTWHTEMMYKNELEEQFGYLNNIKPFFAPYLDTEKEIIRLETILKEWFGKG